MQTRDLQHNTVGIIDKQHSGWNKTLGNLNGMLSAVPVKQAFLSLSEVGTGYLSSAPALLAVSTPLDTLHVPVPTLPHTEKNVAVCVGRSSPFIFDIGL